MKGGDNITEDAKKQSTASDFVSKVIQGSVSEYS